MDIARSDPVFSSKPPCTGLAFPPGLGQGTHDFGVMSLFPKAIKFSRPHET
jgi:hypothetical protein